MNDELRSTFVHSVCSVVHSSSFIVHRFLEPDPHLVDIEPVAAERECRREAVQRLGATEKSKPSVGDGARPPRTMRHAEVHRRELEVIADRHRDTARRRAAHWSSYRRSFGRNLRCARRASARAAGTEKSSRLHTVENVPVLDYSARKSDVSNLPVSFDQSEVVVRSPSREPLVSDRQPASVSQRVAGA
jgi:hypothetical protein